MPDRESAEQAVIEWARITAERDQRIRSAVSAGVSKHRVHQLTGLSRVTIDRIVAEQAAAR